MPESTIVKIEYEPGYIITTDDGGRRTRHPIAPILRAADIPDLTISSLTLLTSLAQVMIVLLRTLQEKEVISDEFTGDFDLEYMLGTLVDDLSAEDVPQ